MPWLLIYTLSNVYLPPAAFQPLILFLLSPKIPLSGYLLIQKTEWVSVEIVPNVSGSISIILTVISQAHVAERHGVGSGSLGSHYFLTVGSSLGNPDQSQLKRTGRSGTTPTVSTHSHISLLTWILAAATSHASPCTYVILTMLLCPTVSGRKEGLARVMVFPESSRACTNQPNTCTGILRS